MPTNTDPPQDDLRNPKLPPSSQESEPAKPSGGFLPTAGVSPKLKFFVIGLTFVTIMAFGVFTALFIKKAFFRGADSSSWGAQMLVIAQELQAKGLQAQAIDHYQKYLDTQKVNSKTRSRISFDIATLYDQMGQCDDAAVWFLHAKTAHSAAPWVQHPEEQLQQCRDRIKIFQ